MQRLRIFGWGVHLGRLTLALALCLLSMPQAQAAPTIAQPREFQRNGKLGINMPLRQTAIVVNNTNTAGPGSLHQALIDASPGDTITLAPTLTQQENGIAVTAMQSTAPITSSTSISNININIVVNPDHLDQFSSLTLDNGLNPAAIVDLLFNGISNSGIDLSVPISVNLPDLGESGTVLATDTACDLVRLALEAQGLDAITLDLLSTAACALISDAIGSAVDALTAEVESVLNAIGPLDENTLLNFSGTVCDLINQGISAGDLDPLVADLLSDVICVIVTDNITALNNEIVAIVDGGIDETALLDLASTVSNLLVDALQDVLPSLDTLGLLGGDGLGLIGDLTGVDINVSFTVALPGELEDGVLATVIVTINQGEDPEPQAITCGGYTLVEDGAGGYTAPGFVGTLIVGTNAGEELQGTAGNDLILGLGGDDEIYGDNGDDLICGGLGVDVLHGENGDDTLYGEDDADWLIGGNNNDTLYGGPGNDDLESNNGADLLYGEEGNDILLGGNDNDELHGGGGDDYIDGDNGDDNLDGGDGADELYGGTGNDTLAGGAANDELYGDNGNDDLDGGDGDDYCDGGNGTNTLASCESPAGGSSSPETALTPLEVYRLNDDTEADIIHGQEQNLFLPIIMAR